MTKVEAPQAPPTIPKRNNYLLAMAAIFVSSLLGGYIGYGIAEVSCTTNCTAPNFVGAVMGCLMFGIGTGIVSVLMLKAKAEWERTSRRQTSPTKTSE